MVVMVRYSGIKFYNCNSNSYCILVFQPQHQFVYAFGFAGFPSVLQFAWTHVNNCDWWLPTQRNLSNLSTTRATSCCNYCAYVRRPSSHHRTHSQVAGECWTQIAERNDRAGKYCQNTYQCKKCSILHQTYLCKCLFANLYMVIG